MSVTVTDVDDRQKKPAHLRRLVYIHVLNPEVDFTYQYLWDHHFSNLKRKRHQRSIATAFRKV
ncbi:hypothetical protein MF573_22425 [Klebsiella pneumoniae]|nr:hypothetical protein MF573_22425 [Klebsiella pneumoniae]